jgi:mannose-6-phosphate isomerase-like protein (cupin superfamily)
VRLKGDGLEGLEQTVLECGPGTTTARATGESEEVLFVVAGQGELRLGDGESHPLEPDTGINLGPGREYELRNETSDPMRMVSVQIRGPAPPGGDGGGDGGEGDGGEGDGGEGDGGEDGGGGRGRGPARTMVRRLADQEAQDATTDRSFRIVADPSTGLRSATHFVGYVPTVRAPDHFHTYDEVIYILEGEGAFHAGGTSRPVGAGSCIELPARTVHCLENTGPDVMRLVAVFRPAGSPAAAYYPDGTPAYPGTPALTN